MEGIVSKRADRHYLPGDRSVWVKSKCFNRAEFVIVGWSEHEGSRNGIGALLLGYYEPDGRLLYARRVGTGMTFKTLAMLHARLSPLSIPNMAFPWRRRARRGLPGLWRCPRCIGLSQNSYARSLISPCWKMACCAIQSQGNELKLTEPTKRGRRPTSGAFMGLDDRVKD